MPKKRGGKKWRAGCPWQPPGKVEGLLLKVLKDGPQRGWNEGLTCKPPLSGGVQSLCRQDEITANTAAAKSVRFQKHVYGPHSAFGGSYALQTEAEHEDVNIRGFVLARKLENKDKREKKGH